MDSKMRFDSYDRFVHPGGCYLRNELIRCALDEYHCEGLEFRSARKLLELQDPVSERCQRPHPDFVGMCSSEIDNFHCTGHKSGCVIQTKFIPNVPYCTVKYNHFPDRDTHLSLYGTCSIPDAKGDVKETCVWSINDCPIQGNDVTFAPATYSSYQEELCTCDKVQTGACVYNENTNGASATQHFTCAVSADSCDPDSSFLTWQEVLASGKDCRLCTDAGESASEVAKEQLHSWRNNKYRRDRSSANNSAASCSAGTVAGIAVGGLVTGLLVVLVIALAYRRRMTSKSLTYSSGEDAVPKEEVSEEKNIPVTTGTVV